MRFFAARYTPRYMNSESVVSATLRKTTQSVATMTLTLMLAWKYLMEAMFFSGLVGCASVVIVSWVSIFKDGFSSEDDQRDEKFDNLRY